MHKSIKKTWMQWRSVVFILFMIAAIVFISQMIPKPVSNATSADLSPLSLAGHQRLLVLAPHCDDETLGSGGLIVAALRAGLQVRVVIATNGDGYFFATAQEFHKLYPSARDYFHMGEVRQQESLAALKVLGVNAEQVSFLGYPDRGTPAEWNDYWSAQSPYRSAYSQDSRSPYPLTYDPKSVYAGADFLADVKSLLESYRPDLIVYPHPDDVHPDHWGLNVFTRLAITEVNHADPAYAPTQLTYLVHRADFPTIRGLKPQESLVPPPALFTLYQDWIGWDLTSGDVLVKEKAVQSYRSQLPLLHSLMDSFVRTNELFAPVENMTLSVVVKGDPLNPSTWTDANGQPILPVERDPVGDFLVRSGVPEADLAAAYLARDASHTLWMCAQVREDTTIAFTYLLRLKALKGDTVVTYGARTGEAQTGWEKATSSGPNVCAQASLAGLGDPWAVFFGTDVDGGNGILMDQTGWQMVAVNSKP